MKGGQRTPTGLGDVDLHQDDEVMADVGTIVKKFLAGSALRVGDVVYLSAADTVNKTTTLATLVAHFVGIVVGGTSTGMKVAQDDADITAAAAASGEVVLVAIAGIAKVMVKTDITLGTKVTGDNASTPVAGEVAVDNIAAGKVLGFVLNTTTGHVVNKLLIQPM